MDKIKKNGGYSESNSKPRYHVKKNVMMLESNSKKSKVISKLLLPEDLVIDILSRVSLKCLLSSARYVCKSWAAIIGSSTFAEVYRQCARSKPGILVVNVENRSYYFLDIKDDLNGHFERIDLGTFPDMGEIRSTCDGILLFWDYREQILVVNPILKCCLRVPPSPTQEALTAASIDGFIIARVPRSSIFKLFFVGVRKVLGVDWFVLYVLKVGIDNSWKEIATRQIVLTENCCNINLIYSGDNDLYWILKEGVIVMDVDKEVTVGEYPLPPLQVFSRQSMEYLWMGNNLSCIISEPPTMTFQIYILDINSRKWSLYHKMELSDCVHAFGLERDAVQLLSSRLWMNEQIIFELYFGNMREIWKKIHFGYNVKTGQLTKIEDIPVGVYDIWLHTNSLASFLSTP